MAMSCRLAFLLSPKPGALTHTTLRPPRSLLTMKPARASDSTSSATTMSGLDCFAQKSRIWNTCWKLPTLPSTRSTAASSNSVFCVLESVMKYGEMYPRSNFIPSTHSSSSWRVLPSWIVITPSLVTFSMARASSLPTSTSPFAEIVATCWMRSVPWTGCAIFLSSAITSFTDISMPRRTSVGFIPAATALHPSRKIERVRIVAEVVPSPATSLVLLATERTSCAPRLMARSLNSISLATETPSLVMRGAPYAWSRITERPLGPRVTLTTSASLSTPTRSLARASLPKMMSLPEAMPRAGADACTRTEPRASAAALRAAGFWRTARIELMRVEARDEGLRIRLSVW
mmetsp:Transcript_22963/g.54886  ORF Transcript_22963/g.54886 Transcript_22963/m.54886 type:complete len:346 (-) Transcript_22963:16-1053(-)